MRHILEFPSEEELKIIIFNLLKTLIKIMENAWNEIISTEELKL